MPRKLSKSECDIPSLRYELTSDNGCAQQNFLTPRLGYRRSVESISSNICPACVDKPVIFYTPICKHIVQEKGFPYIKIPKRSIDSTSSSNCDYGNCDANDIYNNIICTPPQNRTPYDSDDTDGVNRTDKEIDKLLTKINDTKKSLLKLQAEQDANVSNYLNSVDDNCTESQHSAKCKAQFERKNNRTNATIQSLQRKLDKQYQQIKRLEQGCGQYHEYATNNRLIQVVHDHACQVRSRASSFQENVVEHLEQLSHNLKRRKKRSMSMDDMELPFASPLKTDPHIPPNHNSVNNHNRNNTECNPNLFLSRSESEEDICERGCDSLKEEPSRKTGIVLANIFHQYLPENPDLNNEELEKFRERLESLERDGYEMRERMEKFKETLEINLRCIKDEEYNINILKRRMLEFEEQWNDMTELHQNETSGIREEIERCFECIERIEYCFTDKNSDLSEQIETCGNRLCVLEKENEEISIQPYQIINLKFLVSKTVSFCINILVSVVLVALFVVKTLAYPFSWRRKGVIVIPLGVITLFLLWANSSLKKLFSTE